MSTLQKWSCWLRLIAIPVLLNAPYARAGGQNGEATIATAQKVGESTTRGTGSASDSGGGLKATESSYRIGEGDVLQILVWKEPDASIPSVVVRPDGKIAMPLLKEVDVLGLTQREAENVITQRLSKLIRGADVTVVVTAMNSKKIYLVGAVRKEGPIQLQRRMTILQALSEGGGLNEYAKSKRIYLLRNVDGIQRRFAFNYDAVIKGEHMQQNIYVQPDDTVVVPH